MRGTTIFVFSIIAAVSAVSTTPERILGGSVTTINQYPYGAALLLSQNLITYTQHCAGTILNARSILSVTHCFYYDPVNRWRVRVGSSYANSGGTVLNVAQFIFHPSFLWNNLDSDIAILRTATNIPIGSTTVRAASIPSATYNLLDNQAVWAIGWGRTSFNGQLSEQLNLVQVSTVNQAVCRTRYAELRYTVTDNMLCAGLLDTGGRDVCQMDNGGPLIHNNVVVGITSWGEQCGHPRYPSVYVRVPRFTTWIQANA